MARSRTASVSRRIQSARVGPGGSQRVVARMRGSGQRGMSVIGSIKSSPHRPSNESHQPTDPAECRRYKVNPGAKNEQRADKIQQPTDTLGLHSLSSGKLSTRQNRGNREPCRDVEAEKCRRNYRIVTRRLITEALTRIKTPSPRAQLGRWSAWSSSTIREASLLTRRSPPRQCVCYCEAR